MFARSLLFLFLLSVVSMSAADIEQILKGSDRWKNQIYGEVTGLEWIGEDLVCYRVKTGPDAVQFVTVNLKTGERKAGADISGAGLESKLNLVTSQSLEELRPSDNGGASTKIAIQNKMADPVKVFWVDADGKRREYKTLAQGQEFRQNTFAGHVWLITQADNQPLAAVRARLQELEIQVDGMAPAFAAEVQRRKKNGRGVLSPDGQWSAFVESGALVVRRQDSGRVMKGDAKAAGLSPFTGGIAWRPDSSGFVVSSCEPLTARKLTLIESSPSDQVQPKKREMDYVKPGDALPSPVPVMVRITGETLHIKAADTQALKDAFIRSNKVDVRWAADGSEYYLDINQRGHQRYSILAVRPETGAVRTVVEETSPTFIDYTRKTWRQWLDTSGELLWMSERDGWCHLWLYDVAEGTVKNQVTTGKWVVRKVEHVDEAARRVWFMASGLRSGEDPYYEHLCVVNFDGSGFRQLTEGQGTHAVQWSPDHRHVVVTWSRVDQPPVAELRRSEDGRLVASLEKADAISLLKTGWTVPERIVAKGRDGKTDIHGIVIKPTHFDPAKSYPVVEQVYAGPHSAFVPKEFGVLQRQHEIAEMGFIVVQADGMGTNHRGKVFHDVCWQNLKDAGFPDRMAWIKAAAASRPWMDLSRVGIYGGSAGGQSAMRALLDHSDFYHVAVADCGCHDNRMDKIWWNEQWLGWPVNDVYLRNSNVADAARLKGELLLIVGELDDNVDPSSTLQVVRALQKAGKVFDFMPIIGAGHGAAETAYGTRLRMRFLERHLLSAPLAGQ